LFTSFSIGIDSKVRENAAGKNSKPEEGRLLGKLAAVEGNNRFVNRTVKISRGG
jgi:hypothetical protein